MDVTINQLRVFCEVARRGSFTRAAEALYVSQPAVSKSVKDLERQVGSPLFEKIGRRAQLTDAGRLMLEYAGRMLAELTDAERALASMGGGQSGRLVIGASNTPGTYLLPAVLGEFRRVNPGVEVALEIADTATVLRRLREGRLDLGVVGEAAFPPALVAELHGTDRLVLILAPLHPLAQRRQVGLRDLAAEPFVFRQPGSSTREVLERALHERAFQPNVTMELGSAEAVKKTVAAGLGIAFVSEHAVELELGAGALATRPVAGLDLRRGIYVVRRASLSLTPIHRRFLAALRAGGNGSEG